MNLLKSKLVRRFLVQTSVVVLITFALIYILTMYVLDNSLKKEVYYRDELLANTLSKRMNDIFDKILHDTRVISQFYGWYAHMDESGFYHSEIERIVAYNPLYMFVHVYDAEGRTIESVPEIQYVEELPTAAFLDRLTWSRTYYFSPLIDLPGGKKAIAVVHPILDDKGEMIGGTSAYVNVETLSNYLNDLKIDKQGFNTILDARGTIVAHSDQSYIGTSLADHELYDFLYKQRYGIRQDELFGQQQIVAYRPMKFGQMGLLAGEAVAQAMAPAKNVQNLLRTAFLITMLMLGGLVIYGSTGVLRPILQLTRQAQEYKENARKKFDLLTTKDELQDLSVVMDQMARELTEKERRLFYILESMPYIVITINNEGQITTFNKAAETITQYQREELIGKSILEIPFKESKDDFLSWKTLKEGMEFHEVESYITDKYGNRYDVKIHSSLFRGEDDKVLGALLVIRDVSEIKKMEDYLRQTEKLAALGQITASIAHEIKNPLSIIQAAAEAAEMELNDKEPDYREIRELIQHILNTSDRMNHLLTNFLLLSKKQSMEDRSREDLIPIIEELLYLLRHRIREHRITVERFYEPLTAEAWVSRNEMAQVFLNILLNALQAIGDEGGVLRVSVRDSGETWTVEISDTGKGIHPNHLPRIFNPFYSTKPSGTGLGLSVAHEIMIRHGGTIRAESEEGKGATLILQIPKCFYPQGSEDRLHETDTAGG